MLLYWKHERIFKMLMWLIGAPIKKTKKTPFMPQYFTSSNIKKKKYWRCRWHQDIFFYSQVWYYFLVKNATIADTNLLYWVLWLFFFFFFFSFFISNTLRIILYFNRQVQVLLWLPFLTPLLSCALIIVIIIIIIIIIIIFIIIFFSAWPTVIQKYEENFILEKYNKFLVFLGLRLESSILQKIIVFCLKKI